MKRIVVNFTDGTRKTFVEDNVDLVESSEMGVTIYSEKTDARVAGRLYPWHRIRSVSEEYALD